MAIACWNGLVRSYTEAAAPAGTIGPACMGYPWHSRTSSTPPGFRPRMVVHWMWDACPRATRSSWSVLIAAGAVVMGKSVTTELAYMEPGRTPQSRHAGEHTPGGSSSGSAAAVGADMVPLAIGTQTRWVDHPTGGLLWGCRLQAKLRPVSREAAFSRSRPRSIPSACFAPVGRCGGVAGRPRSPAIMMAIPPAFTHRFHACSTRSARHHPYRRCSRSCEGPYWDQADSEMQRACEELSGLAR